jgi:hypothetical protein
LALEIITAPGIGLKVRALCGKVIESYYNMNLRAVRTKPRIAFGSAADDEPEAPHEESRETQVHPATEEELDKSGPSSRHSRNW